MTAPHASEIIEGYLARLEADTADIPRPQREDVVESVREHIAEARAGKSSLALGLLWTGRGPYFPLAVVKLVGVRDLLRSNADEMKGARVDPEPLPPNLTMF